MVGVESLLIMITADISGQDLELELDWHTHWCGRERSMLFAPKQLASPHQFNSATQVN